MKGIQESKEGRSRRNR